MAATRGSPGRSSSGAEAIVDEVKTLRPARAAAARASRPASSGTPSGSREADQKYIVCNADEGDSGTFADRMLMEGDPFCLIEGMTIAALAVGRHQGLHLHPLGISARLPDHAGCDRRPRPRRAFSARASPARARPSRWKRGSAPAPISAARKPRCSKASKAGAASCAPSRRCRRSRACSASRRSSTTCCPSRPCPGSWRNGAQAYADFGMGRSRGTLPIQLAGNIKHGGLFETAFGLTLARGDRGHRRRHALGPADPGRAGRRPARRLFPREPVRHAARLRGLRGQEGPARPWRHRGVRRHRRPRPAGPLRLRVLRPGKLRQVHALPHRRDARRRDDGQDHRRPRAGQEPRRSSTISAS